MDSLALSKAVRRHFHWPTVAIAATAQSNRINQTSYRRRIQSAVNSSLSVFMREEE